MPDATKSLKLAGAIVKQVQVRDIFLYSAIVRRKDDPMPDESLRVSYGLRIAGRFIEFHDETPAPVPGAQVSITFHLKATPQGSPADSTDDRLYIEAEFRIAYQLQSREGIGDEHLDAFARMNGLFNAWPYWREYVQSTTARMGLPPLVVPVLTSGMLVNLYQDADSEPAKAAPNGGGKKQPKKRRRRKSRR